MDSDTYGYDDFIQEIDRRLKNIKLEEVNQAIKNYLTPILYQTPNTSCEILEEDKIYEIFDLKPSKIEIVRAEELFLR